jgi:hypothetical protein
VGIFQDSQVVVLLADYIGVDAGGKINALGAGFSMLHMQPTGLSGPMYMIVMIDVHAKYAGQQYAVSIELRNETTGQPVMLAAAPAGQLEPLRIQQVLSVQSPQGPPGFFVPVGSVPSRQLLPIAFQDGLPLEAGHMYAWKVQIDGQGRPGWESRFFVPGPQPPPVIGGPVGPADIPNVHPPDG